ncbi:MAG: glycosyltransferase family 2 protein [Chloroflexota bacterium]|nr:glycosyltransferase [Dehalococcoidia bacterium]MDW8252957.1 glycosyltransferase family 2 protein [Chloroflexota bacterium]
MTALTPAEGSGFAVVICTYTEQRRDLLLAALASVQAQTLPPDEIVVVADGNERLFARLQAIVDGARVIRNPGPPGLSGARNAGVAATTAPLVAFLDDDAVAEPTWLERLAAAYAADARIIGVGGAVAPRWLGQPPSWLPAEFLWTIGCSYRGLPTASCPVRNVIGANMSFRRWAILAVGGFNHAIGQIGPSMQRGDDTELCIRLTQRLPRATILYEPSALIRHAVPPERTTMQYFLRRCYTEGLAKAHLARLVGAQSALAEERRYALVTVPRAIVRELVSGRAEGVQRAAAIGLGLVVTALGYLQGRIEHLI